MAVRQFALRVDEHSKQTGNTSFKELIDADAPVNFELTNVASGETNQLNLITRVGTTSLNHIFELDISDGQASVTLAVGELVEVYDDACKGTLDYIEASWTLGTTDSPGASVMYMVQNSRPYDYAGWPAITQ